jgi:glycosyltransferase involved in cell wall biosynthesis
VTLAGAIAAGWSQDAPARRRATPSRGPRLRRGSHLVACDVPDEDGLSPAQRLLLVEQLDAVGASPADLRPRAQLLRKCGFDVRMLAVAPDAEVDLQYGTPERPQPGIECIEPAHVVDGVARAAEDHRAQLVVWASASSGGGAAARAAAGRLPAWWWPTGWSSPGAAGPLPELAPGADPCELSLLHGDRARPKRLSLWDGPYVVVASPLRPADAERLFDGFARAADRRDDVDLVVLDHPDAALEAVAREAGILQRVHFVGRAPREAEEAWLQHARLAFVTLHRPVGADLVRRALAAGCPLLPVGSAAAPLAAWLRDRGLAWARGDRSRLAWDTIAAALGRTPAVETAVLRGRALVEEDPSSGVAARVLERLPGAGGGKDLAA